MDKKGKEDLVKEFRCFALDEEWMDCDIFYGKIKELIEVMNDDELHAVLSEPDLEGAVFTEGSEEVIEIIAILCAKGYLKCVKLAHRLFHVNGGQELTEEALEAYVGKDICEWWKREICYQHEFIPRKCYKWIGDQYHKPVPLCAAIYYGQTHVVEYLLSIGTLLDEENSPNGCLPLNISCERGYLEITKLLIEHGADWKRTDYHNFDCLFMASCQGFTSIVQYLIGLGAEVKGPVCPYEMEEKAFGGACFYSGDLHSVTEVEDYNSEWEIFHYGVYPRMFTGEQQPIPRAERVESNHVETIKVLLQHGKPEDLLYSSTDGGKMRSAFMSAAMGGSEEVLDFLLQLGNAGGVNDVSMGYSSENEWPLSSACRFGNLAAVRFLISRGAFISSEEQAKRLGNGWMDSVISHSEPIEEAALCTQESGKEILKLLIQHGATVDVRALRNAASCSNVEAMEVLLAALDGPLSAIERLDIYFRAGVVASACGVQCGSHNKREYEEMKLEEMTKRMKIVKMMLDDGFHSYRALQALCDGNIRKPQGMLEFLISYGCDINQELESGVDIGDTPLNAACRNLDLDLIDFLLNHGADINKWGKEGLNPLQTCTVSMYGERDYCYDYSKEDIIRYLCEEKGANVHMVCPKSGHSLLDMVCLNYEKRKPKVLLYYLSQGLSLQPDTLSRMLQEHGFNGIWKDAISILLVDNAISTGHRQPGPAGRELLNIFEDSNVLGNSLHRFSLPLALKMLHEAGFVIHVSDELEQKIMASNNEKTQKTLKLIQDEVSRVPKLEELSIWAVRRALGPGLFSLQKMDQIQELNLPRPAINDILFLNIIEKKYVETIKDYLAERAKGEKSQKMLGRNRPQPLGRWTAGETGLCHRCQTDHSERAYLQQQKEIEEACKWATDFVEQCQKESSVRAAETSCFMQKSWDV